MVEVRPVNNRRMLGQFIDFPHTKYRAHPHWTPQLRLSERHQFDPTRNPFFASADMQMSTAFWLRLCRRLAWPLITVTALAGQPLSLPYAPAPADNPLKGFVVYLRADATFPHSLEWDYKKTKLVARYPAGPDHPRYAENSGRAMGYHDDSFAWATVHSGKPADAWFFETRLRAAGALAKWRTQPIGGEVRPEVWPCLFNEPSCAPKGQEFDRCLTATHASWLCNEGVFRGGIQGAARDRAIRAVQRMGYELHVTGAELKVAGSQLALVVTVTNTGVAPFYYDWPVELGVLDAHRKLAMTWKTDWKLSGILPGDPVTVWRARSEIGALPPGRYQVLARVPNPLPRSLPLRFANQAQDQHVPDWLTLGRIESP